MTASQSPIHPRRDAANRFRALQNEAYAIAEAGVREYFDPRISLSFISDQALREAVKWRQPQLANAERGHAEWSWSREIVRARRRTRYFELAIWHDDDLLCGLSIGRSSNKRVIATIHLLEGSPEATPLTGIVGAIAVWFLEVYARLLGCKQVAVSHPVPGVIPHYQSLGLTKLQTKGKKVILMSRELPDLDLTLNGN